MKHFDSDEEYIAYKDGFNAGFSHGYVSGFKAGMPVVKELFTAAVGKITVETPTVRSILGVAKDTFRTLYGKGRDK